MKGYYHPLWYLIFIVSTVASAEVIQIPGPRAVHDVYHDYHVKLLNLVPEAAADGRTVPKIASNPQYEARFDMLEAGRCDYFPRGYHERSKELKLMAKYYPQLTSYDGIMLHYPFAVYFFTHKDNQDSRYWFRVTDFGIQLSACDN